MRSSSYRDNNDSDDNDPLGGGRGGDHGPDLYHTAVVEDDANGNTRMTKMGSMMPSTTSTRRRRSPWCNKWFCGILLVGIVLLLVAVPLSMSGINNAAADDPNAAASADVDENGVPDFVDNGDFDAGDGPNSEDLPPSDEQDLDDGSEKFNLTEYDGDSDDANQPYMLLQDVNINASETVQANMPIASAHGQGDDAGDDMVGYDGMPSPLAHQVDFGCKVAISLEGWRIAVAAAPGPAAAGGVGSSAQGLVHVFKHNQTWLYEQTLTVQQVDNGGDVDTGIAPPVADTKFHPALAMSDDGLRVAFSTPQNDVAVFVKLSKFHGFKWRQLGPSITLAEARQNGDTSTRTLTDHMHIVDVALSGNGLDLAILWSIHANNVTTFQDSAVVQIYQDLETTDSGHESTNPVIDQWQFRADIPLPSSSHGTLSFSFTGHELAVGQHSRIIADPATGDEDDDYVPAVVSVYMVDKSDPTQGTWLPAGEGMIDGVTTLEGHERPLSLGGIVHLSADGTTLAVGGMSNAINVLKRTDADDEGETPTDGDAVIVWKPIGMGGKRGVGVIMGPSEHSNFGSSVHLNRYGTRLVVGAPGSPELLLKDPSNLDPDLLPYTYGAVHVYVLDPEIPHWKLVANQVDDPVKDPLATYRSKTQGDHFGHAVCIDGEGDKVIVGAPHAASVGAVTVVKVDL